MFASSGQSDLLRTEAPSGFDQKGDGRTQDRATGFALFAGEIRGVYRLLQKSFHLRIDSLSDFSELLVVESRDDDQILVAYLNRAIIALGRTILLTGFATLDQVGVAIRVEGFDSDADSGSDVGLSGYRIGLHLFSPAVDLHEWKEKACYMRC